MKKLSIMLVVLAVCFSLAACSSTQSEQPDSSQETPDTLTYQSVLDEYTSKIEAATPILIEEYQKEAAQNTEGLSGLAELCNAKISELAGITTEGIREMAEIKLHAGSGEMDEYEEWAGKLQEVYMKEAQKITDAYMKSAM